MLTVKKMMFENLSKLRLNRKLLQKDVAKILGISSYTYSHYETENMTMPIKYLITLSEYYNVSMDYIFGFTNTPNYTNNISYESPIIVGKRLKEFRKNEKFTQVKLATILNIGKGTIADYERGRYLIATPFLYELGKRYHISTDFLLGKIPELKYLK